MDYKKSSFSRLKSIFLSGLFTLIPIAATLFFINFLYNVVVKVIAPLRAIEPAFLRAIPGVEFVLIIFLILGLGIALKAFFVHEIVRYFEGHVARIPLIRIVYSAAKMLVNFFKMPAAHIGVERKVVLIPYPKKGQYHLAFLLESAEHTYEPIIPDKFKDYAGQRYVKVFMPNSPNPTSGYFFIMPQDEVIPTNLSFEEAIKTLVSCGLITPESLKSDAVKQEEMQR
jgi:uncharacterized membrane protein